MQNFIYEGKAEKFKFFEGIHIYKIKTDKFKTNSINVFFTDNLNKENVSNNALIPAVLRRGSGNFKTLRDISLKLEELYGASFDCGVTKKGELQIIQFYVEFIRGSYANKDLNIFERNTDLLMDIITNPVLNNGQFLDEYVRQEKDNQINRIESRVNDKAQYASERCFEEMCKIEPFALYEYGDVNDVKNIDSKSLYEHYLKMLEQFPIYVFVSGDVGEKELEYITEKLSLIKRGKINELKAPAIEKKVDEVKNINDKMDVQQGKLCLGYRTNTSSTDKEYYALAVYNGILGGGIHSKLFQNVREKASLAYYAYSRLEKFKGLMLVSSGIEIENKDKAIDIISKQQEEIINGNISEYEFDSTIKSFETGLKSLKDSQINVVDFYLSQEILNTNETFDSMVDKIKSVKKEEIINVAKRIKLDTIYFLSNK